MRTVLFLFAFTFLLFSACGDDLLYENTVKIPDKLWTYRDTVDFRFTINDTSALYNLYVDFDYAAGYPAQNVYARVHTRFPDGRRPARILSFDLFNSRGETNGKCNGANCKVRMLLQEKAFFRAAGEYVITMEQFTRRDSLPGIGAVGFAVEKFAEKKY